MLIHIIFIYLILICSSCSANSDEPAKKIDTLKSLKRFGMHAGSLMKAVTAELARSKPKNETYKTLLYIKNRADVLWKDIQHKNNLSVELAPYSHKMYDTYMKKISSPLETMNYRISRYIEDSETPSEFRKSCSYEDTSPKEILKHLRTLFVDQCGDPITPIKAQRIADYRAFLMKIFKGIRVDNKPLLPEPSRYFKTFWGIYAKPGPSILNGRFFGWDPQDMEYSIHEFEDEIRREGPVGENHIEGCILHDRIFTSNFNYQHVEAIVAKLMNHLLDATFNAAVCTQTKYFYGEEDREEHIDEILHEVTLISQSVSRWLAESLESAWPSAHNQIVSEQIMRYGLKSDEVKDCITSQLPSPKNCEKTLETIANATHPILMNTGTPNVAYEILIINAEKMEHEIYLEGGPRVCSLNKGKSGFDTIIGRIPLNSTNQTENSDLWGRMLSKRVLAEKLNITIQQEMDKLYAVSYLPHIAETLKSQIGTDILSHDNFHCWAIAREWSRLFYNSCPKIQFLSLPYNLNKVSSITGLSYKNSGHWLQKCEDFRFFFFI